MLHTSMADTLTCDDCGHEAESTDDLETTEVPQVEADEGGAFNVYENNDLYLCKGCKKPLGVDRLE